MDGIFARGFSPVEVCLFKGAPLSCLVLLENARQAGVALTQKDLQLWSDYTDKPIREALVWLARLGLVRRKSHLDWELVENYQAVLRELEWGYPGEKSHPGQEAASGKIPSPVIREPVSETGKIPPSSISTTALETGQCTLETGSETDPGKIPPSGLREPAPKTGKFPPSSFPTIALETGQCTLETGSEIDPGKIPQLAAQAPALESGKFPLQPVQEAATGKIPLKLGEGEGKIPPLSTAALESIQDSGLDSDSFKESSSSRSLLESLRDPLLLDSRAADVGKNTTAGNNARHVRPVIKPPPEKRQYSQRGLNSPSPARPP